MSGSILRPVLRGRKCEGFSQGIVKKAAGPVGGLDVSVRGDWDQPDHGPVALPLDEVQREGDRSVVRLIPIASNGHIEPTDWPRGFFDDSLREALALSAAQNRSQNAS